MDHQEIVLNLTPNDFTWNFKDSFTQAPKPSSAQRFTFLLTRGGCHAVQRLQHL